MIITCKLPYKEPSAFSINIDEILILDIWRILPCDFQIKLRDALDIEVDDLVFKNNILYKITKKKAKAIKKIHNGFLKDGYKKVINFLKQLECSPQNNEKFLQQFSNSTNLTNIFRTFGEPHFHTGTSEGYDIFIYLGTHICSKYHKVCNGILIFVVGLSGNIAAYNVIMSKCQCFFKDADFSDENNIYAKYKKSEFI